MCVIVSVILLSYKGMCIVESNMLLMYGVCAGIEKYLFPY